MKIDANRFEPGFLYIEIVHTDIFRKVVSNGNQDQKFSLAIGWRYEFRV